MPAVLQDDTWTVDMLDALPESLERYEIIDGVLYVTPAPSMDHARVVGEFFGRLREYVRSSASAMVIGSPSDVRRGDRTRNRVQPDVFVVRKADGKRPEYPFPMNNVLLAIEVLSPSNPTLDRKVKRQLYLKGGMPEYWIADPNARVVTRWRGFDDPGELVSDRVEWRAPGATAPLVIDLQELFNEALRF